MTATVHNVNIKAANQHRTKSSQSKTIISSVIQSKFTDNIDDQQGSLAIINLTKMLNLKVNALWEGSGSCVPALIFEIYYHNATYEHRAPSDDPCGGAYPLLVVCSARKSNDLWILIDPLSCCPTSARRSSLIAPTCRCPRRFPGCLLGCTGRGRTIPCAFPDGLSWLPSRRASPEVDPRRRIAAWRTIHETCECSPSRSESRSYSCQFITVFWHGTPQIRCLMIGRLRVVVRLVQ